MSYYLGEIKTDFKTTNILYKLPIAKFLKGNQSLLYSSYNPLEQNSSKPLLPFSQVNA